MNKSLVTIFLLICLSPIFLLDTNRMMIAGDEAASGLRFGVNYFSTHNHYEPSYLSDEELNRDFKLFHDQGLEYVTLCAIWNYTEPEFGVYDESAIDDLARVCSFAAQYDLKVNINFYTTMNETSPKMPDWISPRKFETVFLNETVREAWLNFLDHCAARLNNSEIWSWHMMNEPYRDWGCNVTIDDFVQLWTEMKAVFKAYSDRPVTVRFAANAVEPSYHFNNDPRIYTLFDYLALNYYEEFCPPENFTRVVLAAQQHNCQVIITEFGSETDDDSVQTSEYKEILELFRNVGVTDCIAWMWRADFDYPNPEPPGIGFNLAKSVDGTPRSAFNLLTSAKKPETVYLAVRGSDNVIYYRSHNVTTGYWASWNSFAGSTVTSPAATLLGNELHMVVCGADGITLWHSYTDLSSGEFSGWMWISGDTPSPPTLVSNGTHMCLVVRGSNNSVYYRVYEMESRSWGDWNKLISGSTCDKVSATMIGNKLTLIVRGYSTTDPDINNTLWQTTVDVDTNTYPDWTWIPGSVTCSPTLSIWKNNKMVLVVAGMDDGIYINTYEEGVWMGWEALPQGSTLESPGATVIDDDLHLLVVGMDAVTLWHSTLNLETSEFSGWIWISGTTSSKPVLAR